MHETVIHSRNQNAECRRCGRGFSKGETVHVTGKPSAHKYYCPSCADKIVIEVE